MGEVVAVKEVTEQTLPIWMERCDPCILSQASRKSTRRSFSPATGTIGQVCGPREVACSDWPQFFKASPTNSNNAFVAGSSGVPRLALIRLWLVSWAPKTLAGMPASFSTVPRRCACAEVSG